MERTEKELKAIEIFSNYTAINEIFITEDLQGFTELHRAENHAKFLKSDEILRFERGFENASEETPEPEILEDEDLSDDSVSERELLAKEYEAIFGKKAPHNIGLEKLRAQVSERKNKEEN